MILDVHCHILPGIDDGAKTVDESIGILTQLKEQGVNAVIATPHFYSHANTIERFLKNRAEAYKKISACKEMDKLPPVFLGAEVRYFRGISKVESLNTLTLAGSAYMLLEPPFSVLSAYMIDEIQDLAINREIIPIIAHVDRYLQFDRWEKVTELFRYGNVFGQVNAGSLVGFLPKRKNYRLLSEGYCHFIGSDAHNLAERKPEMKRAFVQVERICGTETIERIKEYSIRLYSSLVQHLD